MKHSRQPNLEVTASPGLNSLTRDSITSPTARALIGKKVGDSVEVNTPGGGKRYEIVKVDYK